MLLNKPRMLKVIDEQAANLHSRIYCLKSSATIPGHDAENGIAPPQIGKTFVSALYAATLTEK
jgi:hypothetical protein